MMSSPIVLLSSFNDEQRRKFTSLIEKLGGRVLQSVGYDQRCTHVVVGAILSTEKLLAGAIAGKWVVSPEYIECSYKARKWLEAERFILQTVGSGNVKKLSQVPTRWRSFRQQNGNQGPFRSWRVLLALPDADKTRYKRLLQAGGAHVITDKPPYVWSLKTSDKLTFVFTNKELFITVMSLYKRGVPCIHPDYVKDYIIQHHEPDVSSYRANVYCHPVKKQTTCGYRKITSYIFTTPKSSQPTTRALSKSLQSTTRGLSVRDKNIAHLPSHTRKVFKIKKEQSTRQHVSDDVKSLTVSIPLSKITLKKSCDPVIDLTADIALSSGDCVMSQPPSDCVMSQPPSDCVMSQPPSDCVMSQPPSDCVISQSSSDCIMSQTLSDCVTLQAPSDSTSTQSSIGCVILESPTNHFMSQPSADCVMSQTSPTDSTVLKPSSKLVSSESSSDRVTSQLAPDHTVEMSPSDCVISQPRTEHDMSQPPTDCVMSQPPSDCLVSQPPSDYIVSQLPSDCLVSQPPINHVMSQPWPPTESVVSKLPTDCVKSQVPTDCVVLQLPSDSVMSQLPSDCLISQPPTDSDTFQTQCTNEKINHAPYDEVLVTRLRFSSEGSRIKRCGKKRKRKCVSVAEFSIQHVEQCHHEVMEEVKELESTGISKMINQLPVITMILHQRGLWSTRVMQQLNDDKVMVRTTMDTLLEGYLGNQQSLSRGVKYCHSLLTSQHVPSATLLYHLATRLMSDQLEDKLVVMVHITLSKLLLLHPPHGVVARQQYHKLFDLLIGDTKSGYRKWEGLFMGITNSRPQLLQYLTDIVILDYHRWLSHGDQPLLHKIMWDNRPHDTVTRPLKELTQQFIQLLDNYHDDKYPYLESLCYLMFLTGHYLQSHSATPTPPAAPPPHLRAAQLACSEPARQSMKDRVKCYHDISDYCDYNS